MKLVEVKENEVTEFRPDGHFSVLYANGKVHGGATYLFRTPVRIRI